MHIANLCTIVEIREQTKAFHYFNAAAEMETDADSLFNAGYCLQHGLGVPRLDLKAAARKYSAWW